MDNANDLIKEILAGNLVPPATPTPKEEPAVRRFTAAELVDLMLFDLGIGVADH